MIKFDLRTIKDFTFGVIDNIAFVNTTANDMSFGDVNFATVLPKSGILTNDEPIKEVVNSEHGINLFKNYFIDKEENKKRILDIERLIYKEGDVDSVIIIGTERAMNAFPGLVKMPVAIPDEIFPIVAPLKKRMYLKEFIIA